MHVKWVKSAVGGVVALLLAGTARAQAPQVRRLTVGDAVQLSLERNENVVIAVAQTDQARGAIVETRSRALPKLDLSYNYARNVQRPVIFFNQGGQTQQISIGQANDNTFALSLQQTLFDPGLGSALKAARLAREVSGDQVQDARRQTALATRTGYYQVLLNRQLADVQRKALAQAEARLDQVQSRAKVGLASEFDVLTAQVAVENLRPPLIEAENQLVISRQQLKRQLGVSLQDSLVLLDSLSFGQTQVPPETEIEQAAQSRADRRAAEGMIQLRKAAAQAEDRSSLPKLDLNLALSRRASSQTLIPPDQDFSQSFVVGLQVSWPLFDGRASQGRLLQNQAQLRMAQQQLDAVDADIRLQIREARQGLQAAEAQVNSARATVGRAERALEIAQKRFANGLSTQLELGDAELAVTEARSNVAQALFRYNVARAQLTAALGGI